MGEVTCTFLSLVTSEKPTAEPQVWLNKCGFQLPEMFMVIPVKSV